MKNLFYLLLLTFFLQACHSNSQKYPSLNGNWESIGSGWILEIQDSLTYAFYDQTEISCLPNRKGTLSEILPSLSLENDTLSLKKGVITYLFTRIKTLPDLCSTALDEQQSKDPIYNFEVFVETLKEHYAFMELNKIDWEGLCQEQRNKLDAHSTEAELYLLIEETLERLNDNHAYLEATDEVYEEVEKLVKEEEDIEENDLPEYGDFQVAAMVAQNHLEEDMTKDSWLIQWGKMTEGIGYVQIKAMWLYADLEIPKELIEELGYVDAYVQTFHQMYEGHYIDKEVEGVSKIMDQVMKDLGGMDAIVLDVRFNGGGQDAVSFEILSRFIPQKLQVATQKLKHKNGFSPTLPLYIQASKNAFSKPVYVLTSPQTGSAAEAFSIATLAMSHVRRIGSPTLGAMSTALEKTLPNGWAFAISNEIYMDNEGNNYENKGIPVDVELDYSRDRQTFFRGVVDDLDKDKRDILEAIKKFYE